MIRPTFHVKSYSDNDGHVFVMFMMNDNANIRG